MSLNPYAMRQGRDLAAAEVYITTLEAFLGASPLLDPALYLGNAGATSVSLKVELILDMGTSALLDPLNSGTLTFLVLAPTTVLAGAGLFVDISGRTARWAQTYSGLYPAWTLSHKLTITNLSGAGAGRFQAIVSGAVESFIDISRDPLFDLVRP
jgi:hypothetical protein